MNFFIFLFLIENKDFINKFNKFLKFFINFNRNNMNFEILFLYFYENDSIHTVLIFLQRKIYIKQNIEKK